MMKAFWDPIQLTHAPGFFLQRGEVRRNFEVPARATALLEGCQALGLDIVAPAPIEAAALTIAHGADYLEFLRTGPAAWAALPVKGPELVPNIHPTPEMMANGARRPSGIVGSVGWFVADAGCPIIAETWPAALSAAACALAAADEAAAGRLAYALARPPGHHAYAARAGGHCYLNNAALAAQRLRDKGATRVAVLDIDSHHGHGTQGIFWERSDVVFASVHGDPNGYYPWFVGHGSEAGAGAGLGANLNLPLAQGSGDAVWLGAIQSALAFIAGHKVDALVLSLGFDASIDEPLNYLSVTADGFARAAAMIAATRLPCAIVQEGGYNLDVIGGLLHTFIGAMA